MLALHTAIAILAAIVLIIRFKVDPVISLMISCLYLGLAAGLGTEATLKAITDGFGEIMVEVGLLIGFGVLIGALLNATGTFRDLVVLLVRRVGGKLPYAMAGALSTIFPAIYVDVQVVLAAPMARASAARVDARRGLPWMAGSLGIGIFAGYVFVVPGLAAVAVAGLMDVPLGTYLLLGAPIGLATALITTLLFRGLLRTRYWNPATDVSVGEEGREVVPARAGRTVPAAGGVHEGNAAPAGVTAVADERPAPPEERPAPPAVGHAGPPRENGDDAPEATRAARLPLPVRLLPILVPLVLIAFGAFAELLGVGNPVVAFLGDATVALFIGLVIGFVMVRASLSGDDTARVMKTGFRTMGEILLITGIGGSLGAVITESGLGDVLGGLFSADANAPVILSILLAWFIAAVLHFAIGSVSVAAITAAGIIAPIAGSLSTAPVVIALSIASGALFALHVNSNFFWMFSSLLGLSTKGALKTLTVVTSLGAVVSLPLVLAATLIT